MSVRINLTNQPFFLFKYLTIGTVSSQKEVLLFRYMDGVVRSDQSPNSYGDYKVKTILLEKKLIKVQVWNTMQCESVFQNSKITEAKHYRNIDGLPHSLHNLTSTSIRRGIPLL
jgi:hypothetical protein